MRRVMSVVGFAIVSMGLAGCGLILPGGDTLVGTFNFDNGQLGWVADVSDYPADGNDDFDFVAEIRDVPDELNIPGQALYVQSNNTADDLFTFIKRRLTTDDGIEPGRTYRIFFTIQFASNAPSGCAGVGGAPGESVYLKSGAANIEPEVVFDQQENYFGMNVDKGNQSQGGPAASVAGNIANGIPCETLPDLQDPPYVLRTRFHTHDTLVTASDAGELWLLVGTDSAFEATTALYYRAIQVRLRPIGLGP